MSEQPKTRWLIPQLGLAIIILSFLMWLIYLIIQ